jgi:beta-galactosidase
MVSFFRWRSCRFGREQYWHGILYHHGIAQRRYDEVKRIGQEFERISAELDGSEVRSEVAVLFDYNSNWSLRIQPNVGHGFDYITAISSYDRALSGLGISPDMVPPHGDFSPYKLLVAPCVHICTPELAHKLAAFVQNGGVLFLGPRSGVKDAENMIVNELLPGPLRELAGCHVVEYDAFSSISGMKMSVADTQGNRYTVHGLADILQPSPGARILLRYGAGYYRGKPAAVRNPAGKGTCFYCGIVPDEKLTRRLVSILVKESGAVSLKSPSAECMEIARRVKADQGYTFYMNHSLSKTGVKIARPGTDILSGKRVEKTSVVNSLDLMIVKEDS